MVLATQHLAECLTASSDDYFKSLKSEATSSERNRYRPEGAEPDDSVDSFQRSKLLRRTYFVTLQADGLLFPQGGSNLDLDQSEKCLGRW